MIFKGLFTPGHKSSDSEKRIASINGLDKQKEKDKSILHELAFNDANDDVMLKALSKLDSFVLWMKAADTAHSSKVKRVALNTCIEQLESVEKVSDKLFRSFIVESKNKPLLEKLLTSSTRLKSDESLSLTVLKALDNENLNRKYFQEQATSAQQLELIKEVHDPKVLVRFAKLSSHNEVIAHIQERLDKIAEDKQKPVKIKQQATLINSRLLALKDASDYEYLNEQFIALTDEFNAIKGGFACLDETTAATFSEKFLSLKTSLQQKLTTLESDYRQKQLFKQTTNLISEINDRCDQVVQQINLLVDDTQKTHEQATQIDVSANVKILDVSLDSAEAEISQIDAAHQTASHRAAIKTINKRISDSRHTLNNIPKILVIAGEITAMLDAHAQLLNELSQNDVKKSDDEILQLIEQRLTDDKQRLGQIKKDNEILIPVNLLKQYNQSSSELRNKQKEIKNAYKQVERKCDSKLKVVNNLITQGKFKPAISMFHHVEKMYQDIHSNASMRLKKNFEKVQEEVTKLKDWQAYIAQPRKPELIEQAKKLNEVVPDNLHERADAIKQLRQEYNSLGNLYTEEDKLHNKTFDDLIEQAFAPCRTFFAELEKQREENYVTALNLIKEVEAFDTAVPGPELVSATNAFKTRFSKVGEIDKKHKNKIKRDFNKVLKPLNQAIANNLNTNLIAKQKLVVQAEAISTSINNDGFDIKEAVVEAKSLQKKWKEIGFAGKPDDNKLWQQFRQFNDDLFNHYHKNLSEQKAELQSHLQLLTEETQRVIDKLKHAEDISNLQFYETSRENVLNQLNSLDEKGRKNAAKLIEKMETTYENCVASMNHQKEQKGIVQLFEFLNGFNKPLDELQNEYQQLQGKYRAWLSAQVQILPILLGLDRTQLTQVATILFDKSYSEMPIGDESSRKDLQLRVMASKLEQGQVILPEAVLAAWVSLGPVDANDKQALDVMQALFTN